MVDGLSSKTAIIATDITAALFTIGFPAIIGPAAGIHERSASMAGKLRNDLTTCLYLVKFHVFIQTVIIS